MMWWQLVFRHDSGMALGMAVSVCQLVWWSSYSMLGFSLGAMMRLIFFSFWLSWQLLDGLSWTLEQLSMVSRGKILNPAVSIHRFRFYDSHIIKIPMTTTISQSSMTTLFLLSICIYLFDMFSLRASSGRCAASVWLSLSAGNVGTCICTTRLKVHLDTGLSWVKRL